MPERLTVGEYAEYRGVKVNAVYAKLRKGQIQRTADGRICVADADRLWPLTVEPRPLTNGSPNGSPSNGNGSEPELHRMSKREVTRLTGIYKLENSRKMAAWRDLLIERVKKELLPADGVEKLCHEANRILRDHLLVLPERVAPVLATMQDEDECRRYLLADIRRTLETIADIYHDMGNQSSTLSHSAQHQDQKNVFRKPAV